MEANWFPDAIETFEWFRKHPEVVKGCITDLHYSQFKYSLEDVLVTLKLPEAEVVVVGEQKFSTGWEPVYRVRFHNDIIVLVSFVSCDCTIVVVDSLKPLAVDWHCLFDIKHAPEHEKFTRNSYSINHNHFSIGLQSGYMLSAFFLLLLTAK